MRHHNANRKLGRVRKQRKALLNSLARSLILHQKIRTTEAKAKELRPVVEKLVTKGKEKSVGSMRALSVKVGSKAAKALTGSISPKYADRKGGFTRIIKQKGRLSDGSKMAIIEFV